MGRGARWEPKNWSKIRAGYVCGTGRYSTDEDGKRRMSLPQRCRDRFRLSRAGDIKTCFVPVGSIDVDEVGGLAPGIGSGVEG